MTIVLSEPGVNLLEMVFEWYTTDSDRGFDRVCWGYFPEFDYADPAAINEVVSLRLAFWHPDTHDGLIITQLGADYLREVVEVKTPFDRELAKDAEIARLTAALAASEAARNVADAGWSECIDVNEDLRLEITLLKTDSGIPF